MKLNNLSIAIAFLIVGIISLKNLAYGQVSQNYIIDGKIEGLPKNVTLYLITTKGINDADTIQIIKSKENAFAFNIQKVAYGKIYFVKVDDKEFKPKGASWFRIVMDSPKINVTGIASQWPEVKIHGSASTLVYEAYQKGNVSYFNQFNELYAQLINALPENTKGGSFDYEELINHTPNDTSALGAKARKIYKEWKGFVSEYMKSNINTLVIPLIAKESNILKLEEKQNIYNVLPVKVKNGFYGKELLAFIEQENHNRKVEKKQAELVAGKRMPDFRISSTDGKTLSVLDIVSKSDYTLIDFWASWCVPCRAAIPKIKEVYDIYGLKGFNVLAISTDKDGMAWKKALDQENTKWDNGWDNIDRAGKNIFGLVAIPGYILLDKNGLIVKTDYLTGAGGFKIIKPNEKTLGGNLKEIVAELFKGKSK